MEEIIKQEHAVVYFTADWCQPCKALKPQYAKLAVIDPNTLYYMVDVDKIGSKYINEYKIQSVPQIFEMNSGIINKKIVGKTAETILEEMGKNNAA